jgi:hypothetical protein
VIPAFKLYGEHNNHHKLSGIVPAHNEWINSIPEKLTSEKVAPQDTE